MMYIKILKNFSKVFKVFLVVTLITLSNHVVYVNANENDIELYRAPVRQVYQEVSCMGYTAVIQGTYEVDGNGNAKNVNLTVNAISSGLSVWGLNAIPSGKRVQVSFSFSCPNGNASYFGYVS